MFVHKVLFLHCFWHNYVFSTLPTSMKAAAIACCVTHVKYLLPFIEIDQNVRTRQWTLIGIVLILQSFYHPPGHDPCWHRWSDITNELCYVSILDPMEAPPPWTLDQFCEVLSNAPGNGVITSALCTGCVRSHTCLFRWVSGPSILQLITRGLRTIHRSFKSSPLNLH